jgi:hypothetical protein
MRNRRRMNGEETGAWKQNEKQKQNEWGRSRGVETEGE